VASLRRAEADQRRGEREQRGAHQPRGRDRLRVEEVGDDEEVAEEGGERGVAMGARLEQLEPGEQHQQDDAGTAAEERAVLHPDAEHPHRGDAEHQPARRQRRAVERVPEAPREQAQREHGEPPRRAQRVRRGDQHERGDEPGQVARADGAHGGGEGVRGRGSHGAQDAGLDSAALYSASACSAAPLWLSPRPGGISTPGRRRP
jgi:hypothetical protein